MFTVEDAQNSTVCICPGDTLVEDDAEIARDGSTRVPLFADQGTCSCPRGQSTDALPPGICVSSALTGKLF